MKILHSIMVIPILSHFWSFVLNWSIASHIIPHVTQRNEAWLMTSNCFLQYIAGYSVAKFWRYPIRSRVTKACALESLFIVASIVCDRSVFGLCSVMPHFQFCNHLEKTHIKIMYGGFIMLDNTTIALQILVNTIVADVAILITLPND